MSGDDIHAVVTQTYGISGEVRRDELYFSCPNPDHEDRNPSCSINLKTGTWYCFVCKAHGNLLTLGKLLLGVPMREVERIVYGDGSDQTILRHKLAQRVATRPREASESPVEPPTPPERYEDGPLASLTHRGFSLRLLREWGVRYVREATIATRKGEATITHSVAIPLHDEHGAHVAWCYRRTDQSLDWQPRYLYSLHAPLSSILFGLDKLSKIDPGRTIPSVQNQERVAVTEGALDCLWLWQAGHPAVGLLGSSMTAKVSALDGYTVVLFFDKDTAGYRATVEVGEMLWRKTPVFVARYPRSEDAWKDPTKRKDPADLKLAPALEALERAVPYTAWRVRKEIRRLRSESLT